MKFSLQDCARGALPAVRSFLSLRPVPQVGSWMACATQLRSRGFLPEAAMLMDLVAVHFGREVGRRAWAEWSEVPVSQRGRGVGLAIVSGQALSGPALFGGDVYVKGKAEISVANVLTGMGNRVDVSFLRTGMQFPNWCFAAYCDGLLVAAEHSLYRRSGMLPFEEIARFDAPVIRLAEALEDGTVLVMTAPKSPLLAPDCWLVTCAGEVCVLPLSNVEQRLVGDCVAEAEGYVTCSGGMQHNEVRFLAADGSWSTRFVHERRVVRMARSSRGAVSIDEDGLGLLWQGAKVIGDTHFALPALPEAVLSRMETFDAAVDWARGVLYLSDATNKAGNNTVPSWCVTATEVRNDAFVKQLYPSRSGLTVALLEDGRFHFWDVEAQCVLCDWQLPASCADADDWREVLAGTRIGIEDDPRIRQIAL